MRCFVQHVVDIPKKEKEQYSDKKKHTGQLFLHMKFQDPRTHG